MLKNNLRISEMASRIARQQFAPFPLVAAQREQEQINPNTTTGTEVVGEQRPAYTQPATK